MARPKEFDEEAALVKAANVFWRNGYHNSSMQELVAETGVCRASLYETYGDKHALYLKALALHRKQGTNALKEAIRSQSSAVAQVRAMLGVVVSQLISENGKGCLLTNATLEMLPDYSATVGPFLESNLDTLEGLFTDVLQNGIRSGELPPDLNVPATARFLLSIVGGLNVVGKARPNREALDEIVEVGLTVLS
jgi:TetR/AcrR family transcriptional regulator, transcriptional repressor for nem operon